VALDNAQVSASRVRSVAYNAWGFKDKMVVTWVKNRMGTGKSLRSRSEFCIMAVRGKMLVHLTNQTTALEAEIEEEISDVLHGPMREHSRKPDEFFEMVEELCLGVRRYERFGREQCTGWDVGGNTPAMFKGNAEAAE
jgi:N6-adenosine-specific RNA methylase IME4